MIKILFADFDDRYTSKMMDLHLLSLPKPMCAEIKKFYRPHDQKARIIARLLLREGLQGFGYGFDVLKNLVRDKFGRLMIDEKVDFNLAHSGSYVVCALSIDGKVGIYIEKIIPLDIEELSNCLTSNERHNTRVSSEPVKKFFEYWTQKESVLKADGKGMLVPMSEIVLQENKANLFDTMWFLKRIDISSNYMCHLATNLEDPELNVNKIIIF